MSQTNERKKHFRNIGHGLKPIVTIAGNGLSEGVCAELERALTDHELIKVKLIVEDREDRKTLSSEIAQQFNAEIIQSIGKTVLLYRQAKKPNPKLSNIKRFSH